MLGWIGIGLVSAMLSGNPVAPSEEFLDSVRATSEPIKAATEAATRLLNYGKPDEATQELLNAFPESTRSPVEAYVLGNVLFKREPKISYGLHERAAAHLPEEPNVLLEWAMQQQRAREYEGAATTWLRYLKLRPEHAPAHGLLAECLMQTGQIKEAVAAWKRAETSALGTSEDFESFVSDIHGKPPEDNRRAELLRRIEVADLEAAQEVVCLDSNVEFDWWNSGPQVHFLSYDVVAIERAQFEPSRELDAVLCAAKAAIAMDRGDDIAFILKHYGFLIDPDATLPEHGGIRARLISFAISTDVLDLQAVRDRFGQAILDAAMAGADSDTIHLAARLYLDTQKLQSIDRHGWDSTADPRFAASFLIGMQRRNELRTDSKEMTVALGQFPHDAEVAALWVRVNDAEGRPMREILEHAIKSEYRGFSHGGMLFPRRSSRTLAQYFRRLGEGIEGGPAKDGTVPKPQPK